MTFDDDASDSARRSMRHDEPGQAYPTAPAPADGPLTNRRLTDAPRDVPSAAPHEGVTSRTTSEEARDLLSLRRAKRGEDGAFAELIRVNDPSVRGCVAALVGVGSVDAVMQDTYLRAYRGLPLSPTSSPRIWLLGVADGACRDAIRRWDRSGGRNRPTDSPPIPLTLPAEQRLAIALVAGAGLTFREAGRLVEGGIDAVRAALDGSDDVLEVVTADDRRAPPASDAFWNTLGRRLLVERAAPATTFDADQHRADADDPIATGSPGGSTAVPSLQAGRAARGMRQRVAERSPRVVPWHRIGIAVGVVVTIGAVLFVLVSTAQRASHRDAALGETADKILAKLDQALARDTSVTGTAVVVVSGSARLPVGRYRIARSSAGSYQVAATTGTSAEGWDIPSSTFVIVGRGDPPAASASTGLAPGPPEPNAISGAAVGDLLAESIQIVHRGSAGTVESTMVTVPTSRAVSGPTTTVPGTPVWVVRASLNPDRTVGSGRLPGIGYLDGIDADEVRLVADQSLVLPRRLELLQRGRVVFDVSFVDLSISQQAATSSYAPVIPPGATVSRVDGGFARLSLSSLPTQVGRPLSTPSYLPDGYVLATTSANATTKVAVLGYRNGSQQLTVTLRPPAARPADDPFAGTGASTASSTKPKAITIRSGALRERPGWEASSPINRVWVDGASSQVIAVGDPSVDELVKVVSSMQ